MRLICRKFFKNGFHRTEFLRKPIMSCCITRGDWLREKLFFFLVMLLSFFFFGGAQNVSAQPKKPSVLKANQYTSLPDGYVQVGTTKLYYKQYSDAIDIIGYYNGYYYSSTYADAGYRLAVKVGNNDAVRVDCLNGTTNNGVTLQPSIEQQGELARIYYTVTNTTEQDVTISLGTHADVMIGRNDRAPISRRIDTTGQTYGLTMMDGNGAQLCVLFGSGLAGVTAVNDFWFGYYYTNRNPDNMVGNYIAGSNYMQENGNYDSGMGWCWKDRTIPARTTVVFSYLIGVGEVNLEPNSSFVVTPDDPVGWNDLSLPHQLTLNGTYESPAGLDGIIDYAVEDSEQWHALTDVMTSGSEFTATLIATFDVTKSVHVIKFRTRDMVGNTTMLPPIEYVDVSFHPLIGIEDKTFTGDSIFQTNVTCDLDTDKYVLTSYNNNINAGTASFNQEGVFPYTIGRKSYSFTINPQPLSGSIVLSESSFVYNGVAFTPDWHFSNVAYSDLVNNQDYTLSWKNNKLPGTGTLTVTGKNNYKGILTANFTIDKAQLTDNLFTLTLPEEDITFDDQRHGASVTKAEGVGTATISYQKQGESSLSTTRPKAPGTYKIFLEFADGTLYYGRSRYQVGEFTIYNLSDQEWEALQAIYAELSQMSWAHPWDMSQGKKGVSSLQGLNIVQGHITELNLENQNITGSFPFSILSLPTLKTVNLANNHLSGDLGTATHNFAQQHPTLMTTLQNLNISTNQLAGNIGLFANCFPNLNTLNASHNCFEDVIPMIPTTVTMLDLSSQTMARIVPVNLADMSFASISTLMPTILVYNHAYQTYNPNITLLCTNSDDSWEISAAYQDGQLSIPYVSEQNCYYGASGDILKVEKLNSNGSHEGSTFSIKLSFDQGDSNFDGKVNVIDLQSTINNIFGTYNNNRPFNYTAANVIVDERLNVQDVVGEVNLLLAMDNASEASLTAPVTQDETTLNSDATLYWDNGVLYLYSTKNIAAIDITLLGVNENVIWKLNDYGLTMKASNGHVVAYSLTGSTIPAGLTPIATAKTSAVISNAVMSDIDAVEVSTNFTDTESSGINSIASDNYKVKIISTQGGQIMLTAPYYLNNVEWKVMTTDGRVIAQGNNPSIDAGLITPLAADLIPGVYVVAVIADGHPVATSKIVVLH